MLFYARKHIDKSCKQNIQVIKLLETVGKSFSNRNAMQHGENIKFGMKIVEKVEFC